jgi:hypothetical protein
VIIRVIRSSRADRDLSPLADPASDEALIVEALRDLRADQDAEVEALRMQLGSAFDQIEALRRELALIHRSIPEQGSN